MMDDITRCAPRTGRARTAIILVGAALLSAMVAPAAFAAPSGDQGSAVQPGDGAVDAQDVTAGTGASEASEAQGASEWSADLEAEGNLEAADHLDSIDAIVDLAGTACDDHLVTLVPTGATGPAPQAVAITAQAHEWGQPGWDMASWTASEGTAITAVIAQAADGATSTLSATLTGTAYELAALIFCGTATAMDPSPADVDEEADGASGSATGSDEEADGASGSATGSSKAGADEAGGASANASVMPTTADGSALDAAQRDGATSTTIGHTDAAATVVKGSAGQPAGAADTGDRPFGVVTVDTTSPALTTDGDPNAAHDPAQRSDLLIPTPVAHAAASDAASAAGANGAMALGSTVIGLLTTGLLGAALLALAALRRTARTDRVNPGGQA